jgi:hypothetical protein
MFYAIANIVESGANMLVIVQNMVTSFIGV